MKIYRQLGYPRPVECTSLRSCEELKGDDIVAFFNTHMHIRSMGINFHKIVLPHEKIKH